MHRSSVRFARNRRSTRYYVAILVALAVFAASCGTDSADETTTTQAATATTAAPDDGGNKELVMFVMTASNVYGANQINGALAQAEALGYNLTVF